MAARKTAFMKWIDSELLSNCPSPIFTGDSRAPIWTPASAGIQLQRIRDTHRALDSQALRCAAGAIQAARRSSW